MDEEQLWEAYTAGFQNGLDHAAEGEHEADFDSLRDDFISWQEQRRA